MALVATRFCFPFPSSVIELPTVLSMTQDVSAHRKILYFLSTKMSRLVSASVNFLRHIYTLFFGVPSLTWNWSPSLLYSLLRPSLWLLSVSMSRSRFLSSSLSVPISPA